LYRKCAGDDTLEVNLLMGRMARRRAGGREKYAASFAFADAGEGHLQEPTRQFDSRLLQDAITHLPFIQSLCLEV
jgi:hypothetical protein